jgi:hypothetical protein
MVGQSESLPIKIPASGFLEFESLMRGQFKIKKRKVKGLYTSIKTVAADKMRALRNFAYGGWR